MLHLAIICIVCATLAPSDNTAFKGQKKNESNTFYNSEGGEQNIAKVSFPSVYNVVGRNSSDCAKRGITFFYDYFIKQYQNSKSNSCSIMERVPLGENKNLHSNVDFVYRKRNLLWNTDEKRFQPKTLRPPTSNKYFCSHHRQVEKPPVIRHRKGKNFGKLKSPSSKLDKSKWTEHRTKEKFDKADKESAVKAEIRKLERCTLSPKEKKLFLCLKRYRGLKNNKQKENLVTLQVDDDLDLNKRIKKLVEQLAVENHRKKKHLEERITSERKESEIGHQNLKKEDELSPLLNNIKKIFVINKNDSSEWIVGNTKTDPVSSIRDRYPNPEKAENTVSSYDVPRTMRRSIRRRRNPHKRHNSNECNKNRGSKYKNNLTRWSNPYSANFKANVNFLYPQRSRKFFAENTKKRRWMKMRMRRNKQKKGLRDWRILKRASEKLHTVDTKPASRNRFSDSNNRNRKLATAYKPHRSFKNITGTSQLFSFQDETVNGTSEEWKDSESQFVNSNSRAHEQGESTTENVIESMQPEFLFYSMGKPLLEKQLRPGKLKVIKDINKFVTEGSTTNSVGLQAYSLHGGIKNHVKPLRYLKPRHTVRNNIVHNKVEDPKKVKLLCKRKKRHGSKFSSADNKNWRSPPVLCMPYVKRGQENQPKCLTKVIQNVTGKTLKCDAFEQTKYKSSCGKRRNTPRDFGEKVEANYNSGLPYVCNVPHLRNIVFQPFSFSRFVLNSRIPYETVKVENIHENLNSSLALNPTDTLRGTTGSVQLHQPQTATMSVSTDIPISFPVMRIGKTDSSSKEKVTSSESDMSVRHSSKQGSATSPAPKFSSSAQALVALQRKIPAPTAFSCNASTCMATLAPISTTTCAITYKFPHETNLSPPPVPEPSIKSASGQEIQPSTVNSYALQESESQNENEGTSVIITCKGEECITMVSDSSGAAEEPQIQQRLDQILPEVDAHDVHCADKLNLTALRFMQQPNSESVDSQYRAPESNAGFKDAEFNTGMYNSNYIPRVGRSQNEKSRWRVEMIQKLFGNDRRESTFRNKRFPHSKKYNSRYKKKCSCWMKHFKEKYYRLLDKIRTYSPKTSSEQVPEENESTEPSEGYNNPTAEYSPGWSWQEQTNDDVIFSTPVFVNYLPIYDQQTEEIIDQPTDNPKPLKAENLLPIFGGFNLDGDSYAYTLNPATDQNRNYLIEFTTKPYPMSYDVESQQQFSLKRQKRSDEYYVWPENDYSDYFYDLKNPEGNLPLLNEVPTEAWTPPSYDMFRELAKALVTTENHEVVKRNETEISEITSTVKPVASTSVSSLNSTTNQPPTDHPTANTTNSVSTTVYIQQSVETKEGEGQSSPSVAVTTVAPSPPPTTTITTITTSTTATFAEKIRNRVKGGKKSYEGFSKRSGNSKNLIDSRDDKERQIEELVPAEDIHAPTTLKAAIIVRGQKKFQGKPSPKVYMKVFPDSFEKNEQDGEEALIATTARAPETINIVKTTEQGTAIRTDLPLQILAVCEGYLEVVKLIKAQNQTLAEETDESLARYCENIISQNFNFQSEKSKKIDSNELIAPNTNKKDSEKEPDSNDDPELYQQFISSYDSKSFPDEHFRDISASDDSWDLIPKRKRDHKLTSNSRSPMKRRKRRRNVHRYSRQSPKLRRIRKKKEVEEDLERKGIRKKQKQLIRLLRRRKKALLSWLLTANDGIKPDDLQETEYFDEQDLADPESDTAQYSGTIKPRRDEKSYRKTHKNMSNSRETFYPVYAQNYGYDSGGELIEVEVLWRRVNEKTHENKIFKNLSVLALFLSSTPSPKIKPEETKLVGDDSEIDTETKWKKNKFAIDAAKMEAETDKSNISSTIKKESTVNSTTCSGVDLKKFVKISNKPNRKKQTHTIISKPDPTCIVGAPNCANKTHRKISHKYGVAKDIFQEYSIEFLNYAVYILPVMFTVLFLLCCLCCALQILKIQKSHKKRKKKKKVMSSEDTSVSETESKKRKRETKRKRSAGSSENYNSAHKKKSKTFWQYLKVYSKPSRESENSPRGEMDEENDQAEKKKNFLGFLKGKRDDGKAGYLSAPAGDTDYEPHTPPGSRERKHYSDQYLTNRPSKREHEKARNDEQGEAAERRELIALLEELKKIETEYLEGKKEVKSVQVQYAIPEYDNSLFQPKSQTTDFSYPYEKNVFGMPKGVCPYYNKKFQFHPIVPPSSRDYRLYEEVNELTKLLPWECYPRGNDFLKHCDVKIDQTGRCDRFLKIFRDSGMNCNRPIVDKKCKANESESRSFIFNKYRSISTDKSEELRGVSTKISGTEVRLMENVSPYKLSSNRDEDLVEDVENLKCQLNKKKYVRLKDEGVLCRL